MAVLWTGQAKPDIRKFPAGSKITRAGDGRWVVSGPGNVPVAPAATPPAVGPSAADVAAGNAALPVDLGRSAAMGSALEGIGRMPGLYNPQRMSMAAGAVRDLTGSGLLENAMGYEAATIPGQTLTGFDPDGPGPLPPQTVTTQPDIMYGIHQGGQGRAYRQGFTGVKNQFGAMGSGESSFARRALAEKGRELDAARDDILGRLATGQTQSLGEQQGQFTTDWDKYMGMGTDYADWQANQQVMTPPAVAPVPRLPTVTTPGFPDPYGLGNTIYSPTVGRGVAPMTRKMKTGFNWKPKPVRRVR
jgi:hypothetical protein